MKIHDSNLQDDLIHDRMLDAARWRRSRRRLVRGLAACVPLALVAAIALNTFPRNTFTEGDPGTLVSESASDPEEASLPFWATPVDDVPAVSDNVLLAALSEPELPAWAGPSKHSPSMDDQLLKALSN